MTIQLLRVTDRPLPELPPNCGGLKNGAIRGNYDELMRGHGLSGNRRATWLVERRRIGPVIRELRAQSIRCSGASVSS